MSSPIDPSIVRQLSILSGSVRRLGSDYRSYISELQQHEKKLDQQLAAGTEAGDLKRQREFIEECSATIADIVSRLQAAMAKLEQFIAQAIEPLAIEGPHAEVDKAKKILADLKPLLESHGSSKAAPAAPHRVLVFGPLSLFPLVSAHLAGPGYQLVTQKTPQAAQQVNAMVALPGGLDCLSELLGGLLSLQSPGPTALTKRTIFVFRSPWEAILTTAFTHLNIPADLVSQVRYVEDGDELIKALEQHRTANQ